MAEQSPSALPPIKLRVDIIAGLTAAAVVLPKAMAYATVSGLPVEIGLYTAFVPMIIYALLGSSKVLSVSSTATLAILTATELALVVPNGNAAQLLTATATLSALVGLLLILAAMLRLGFVANFISTPVLTGFKAGIGLVIILDQVPKLFGLHITKTGFFRDIFALLQHMPDTSVMTLIVACATILLLVGMDKLWPHSPAPLLAVAASITVAWHFSLQDQGVAIVGFIPQGLPSLLLPDLTLILQLLPGALGIALMSFTETVAAGRAFADKSDPPINGNKELIATGTANLGGAMFGAMPAGGGTSQTAVVRSVGGRSQRASIITAGFAAATMLFLAPMLGMLPYATLAAVVIVYSVGLIQPREFRAILKIRRMEFFWAMIACLGVLVFGTLEGIVVAIIISLLGLLGQTANPNVYVIARKRGMDVLRPLSANNKDDQLIDGLLMLRPEGRMYFVNTQNIFDKFNVQVEKYRPKVVVIDMSRVTDVEYSALQMIIEGERRVTERGVILWLAGMNPNVLDMVRVSGLAKTLGHERLLINTRAAITQFHAMYGQQSK